MRSAREYAGIPENLRDGDWISMKKTETLLEWIDKNKGLDYVKEAGAYTGKDMGIFKYLFASVMGIENLLKRAEYNYKTIFNFGEISVDLKDNKEAVVTIKEAQTTPYSCIAWEGALNGLMEVTRTNGTVEPVKADNGDCKYVLKWK